MEQLELDFGDDFYIDSAINLLISGSLLDLIDQEIASWEEEECQN